MGFNCLPRGHSDSETCGQINEIICIIFFMLIYFSVYYLQIVFQKIKKCASKGLFDIIHFYEVVVVAARPLLAMLITVIIAAATVKHRDETGSEAHTGCHSSLCIFIVQLPPALQLVHIRWHFYEDNR